MIKEVHNGVLYVDGCNTVNLAKEYGTPLYVLSETALRNKFEEFHKLFLDRYENTRVAFASKAFLPLAMCKLIERADMCLDVVSGGELYTARKAEFPPERIEFNGNNKTYQELEDAVDYGVGRIIIDSTSELPILERICKEKNKKINVLYRITPGVESDTHSHMVTGKKDSKFGIDLEEDVLYLAIKAAIDSPYVTFLGFHFHVGSGIFDNKPYLDALEVALQIIQEVKVRFQFDVKELNIGGGFGAPFVSGDPILPISYFLDPVMKRVCEFSEELGIERPAIVIEPGKALIAEAGITLYTIGSIKEIKGVRKYVAIDGGMTDNIRTELYGAVYEGEVANKMDLPHDDLVTICGKCCESGDVVIYDINIAKPERGDIFAVYTTGAYHYSMASNYNKIPKAPVVLVNNGRSEIIVKRQSYEDMISNEIIPESLGGSL